MCCRFSIQSRFLSKFSHFRPVVRTFYSDFVCHSRMSWCNLSTRPTGSRSRQLKRSTMANVSIGSISYFPLSFQMNSFDLSSIKQVSCWPVSTLPGHVKLLQTSVSVSTPAQTFPPWWGPLQRLVLFLTPPPQYLVHCDHCDHGVQTPSTRRIWNFGLIFEEKIPK